MKKIIPKRIKENCLSHNKKESPKNPKIIAAKIDFENFSFGVAK